MLPHPKYWACRCVLPELAAKLSLRHTKLFDIGWKVFSGCTGKKFGDLKVWLLPALRLCVGSTSQQATVLSLSWQSRRAMHKVVKGVRQSRDHTKVPRKMTSYFTDTYLFQFWLPVNSSRLVSYHFGYFLGVIDKLDSKILVVKNYQKIR